MFPKQFVTRLLFEKYVVYISAYADFFTYRLFLRHSFLLFFVCNACEKQIKNI